MKFKRVLVVGIVLLLVAACSPSESDIVISDAWVRPAMGPMGDSEMGDMDMDAEATAEPDDMAAMGEMEGGGANMTGAFMLIENKGGTADKLISADTDVAGVVEIHETTIVNDVASMSPVDGIEIPANGSVQLKPGSYHIMLMQLKEDLTAGDSVSLTLKFESGKELQVEAVIQETAP